MKRTKRTRSGAAYCLVNEKRPQAVAAAAAASSNTPLQLAASTLCQLLQQENMVLVELVVRHHAALQRHDPCAAVLAQLPQFARLPALHALAPPHTGMQLPMLRIAASDKLQHQSLSAVLPQAPQLGALCLHWPADDGEQTQTGGGSAPNGAIVVETKVAGAGQIQQLMLRAGCRQVCESHAGRSACVWLSTDRHAQMLSAVTQLSLRGCSLAGRNSVHLVRALCRMPQLRTLSLAGCLVNEEGWKNLSSAFPSMQHLCDADFSGTESEPRVGGTPLLQDVRIDGLTALTSLDLMHTFGALAWLDTPPVVTFGTRLAQCTGLRRLRLDFGAPLRYRFVDSLAAMLHCVRSLTQLTSLCIAQCSVVSSGERVPSPRLQTALNALLAALTQLEDLELSATCAGNNGVIDMAPPLRALTRLTRLSLPQSIYLWTQSFMLRPALAGLQGSRFGAFGESLGALPALAHLDLRDAPLVLRADTCVAGALSACTALQSLQLDVRFIDKASTAALKEAFVALRRLTRLRLSVRTMAAAECRNVATAAVCQLTGLQSLCMQLWKAKRALQFVAGASRLQRLTFLDLRDNHAQSEDAKQSRHVAMCLAHWVPNTLCHLALAGRELFSTEGADILMRSIASLSALTHLNLNGTCRSKPAQAWQPTGGRVMGGRLTALQHLDLGCNRLTSEMVQGILVATRDMPRLRYLDLRCRAYRSCSLVPAQGLVQRLSHLQGASVHLDCDAHALAGEVAAAADGSVLPQINGRVLRA